MGGTVAGCPSLITGVTGAGNRSGFSPITGDSVDNEVVNTVTPANTSTSTTLAARAITTPGIPTISPSPRLAHRRAPEAYPDCGAGTDTSSSPCFGPSTGATGSMVRAAGRGFELATGWKRSPAGRVRIEGLGQLTETRSPWLIPADRADPCLGGPRPAGDWCEFTAAITSLQVTGTVGHLAHGVPLATLCARLITLFTRRSLSQPVLLPTAVIKGHWALSGRVAAPTESPGSGHTRRLPRGHCL